MIPLGVLLRLTAPALEPEPRCSRMITAADADGPDADPCPTCHGAGSIPGDGTDPRGLAYGRHTCPTCGGAGGVLPG
jgi:DnaJ-class molecular chaperone